MAKPIKTKIYKDVEVRCPQDGSSYKLNLSVPELTIDISGASHPIYTGESVLVDTAGRIEKFKNRLSKSSEMKPSEKSSRSGKSRKFKQTLAELSVGSNSQPKPATETAKVEPSAAESEK